MNEFLGLDLDTMNKVLNCIKVGVYITDGDGNTVLVNDESCKTGSLSREEVLGRNVRDLVRIGYMVESVTVKVLESKKEESIVQNLGDGGKILVTGNPHITDGKIDFIVCTEWDITEIEHLRNLLKEQDEKTEKYINELAYFQNRNAELQGDIIAVDPRSVALAEKAKRVAGMDTTILLMGESGTGKEVYANLIHQNSKRKGKPFIKVNCAAIPEALLESELFGYERGAFTGAERNGKMGYFELANGGTLFLDEIGDLQFHLQSTLLRVLQEREIYRIGGSSPIKIDIRLIAATNKDLSKEVGAGQFREDLFYRLNVMPVMISPLRERALDVVPLAKSFLDSMGRQYQIKKTLSDEAEAVLTGYLWPGNVRELQNIMERSLISFEGDLISGFQMQRLLGPGEMLKGRPGSISSGATLASAMDNYEKELLADALKKTKNAASAARLLGVTKATMSRRMKKYGLGGFQ